MNTQFYTKLSEFKLKRNDAKKRFQAEIDKMYAEGVPAGASKL